LSEDERQKIHDESVRILEQIGTQFMSERALKILKDHGARIDAEAKIARMPAEMVEQALKTTPKTVFMGGRTPEYDVTLPLPSTGYILDLGGVFTRDFHTGERRPASVQDNEEAMRVFEEMDHGSLVWPHSKSEGTALDSDGIRMINSSFMYTSLHVQDECGDPREVPYIIEAMAAILGSEEEVRKRRLFSVCYCTVAPLVHEGGMCDAYLDLIEFEAPILIYPMPCPGITGPCSLYSTIAMGNAEALSALVLFQMARPGTPLIFGDASGGPNFASGGFLGGSPEMALQTGARGEMARFYGLPNSQQGCLTDAKEPGDQAVLEKMITTLPLVLSGADLIEGTGALDMSAILSLEQIVIDDEIAGLCKRVRDGVDVSEAKNYFEDIEAVGPGGSFLTRKSTLQTCRSDEFYVPKLCDRSTYERWSDLGKPDVCSKARDRVEEILAAPLKNPLPDDVIGKLDDVTRRAAQELD
jgi:trimethylamine--corrinoid protein Co-methyltransferase